MEKYLLQNDTITAMMQSKSNETPIDEATFKISKSFGVIELKLIRIIGKAYYYFVIFLARTTILGLDQSRMGFMHPWKKAEPHKSRSSADAFRSKFENSSS